MPRYDVYFSTFHPSYISQIHTNKKPTKCTSIFVIYLFTIFPSTCSNQYITPSTHHLHITYILFQPVYHTVYTSPTHHLHLVPTSTPHRLHITYTLFQPVYHTVYTSPTHHLHLVPTSIPRRLYFTYTSPTACSNQHTTPSTHHLHITYRLFQPVYHTVHTSPTRWIKTHHTTASVITPHRLNDFNSQDFNHYTFLTCIYIKLRGLSPRANYTYIILTEVIITFKVME